MAGLFQVRQVVVLGTGEVRHYDAIEMVFAHIFPLIWAFQWLAHLLPIKITNQFGQRAAI